MDGAIGAVGVLAEGVKAIGRHRASRLHCSDPHKWMHIPFEAGCVLVRHDAAHRETAFALTPPIWSTAHVGWPRAGCGFSEYGLQLTRQFRALKV